MKIFEKVLKRTVTKKTGNVDAAQPESIEETEETTTQEVDEEAIEALKGEKGDTGPKGDKGEDGKDGAIVIYKPTPVEPKKPTINGHVRIETSRGGRNQVQNLRFNDLAVADVQDLGLALATESSAQRAEKVPQWVLWTLAFVAFVGLLVGTVLITKALNAPATSPVITAPAAMPAPTTATVSIPLAITAAPVVAPAPSAPAAPTNTVVARSNPLGGAVLVNSSDLSLVFVKDGTQGPKGDKGEDGATGPQGPRGSRGRIGPAGADGSDGKDGKDGVDGKSVPLPGSVTVTVE